MGCVVSVSVSVSVSDVFNQCSGYFSNSTWIKGQLILKITKFSFD